MIRKFLPEALVILALLFAFIHATQTTADLHYSYNPDLYRDSGTAETILNGRYPADPLYLGERAWYNPLVPSLVAGISRITQ